jgi:hypothetical protein
VCGKGGQPGSTRLVWRLAAGHAGCRHSFRCASRPRKAAGCPPPLGPAQLVFLPQGPPANSGRPQGKDLAEIFGQTGKTPEEVAEEAKQVRLGREPCTRQAMPHTSAQTFLPPPPPHCCPARLPTPPWLPPRRTWRRSRTSSCGCRCCASTWPRSWRCPRPSPGTRSACTTTLVRAARGPRRRVAVACHATLRVQQEHPSLHAPMLPFLPPPLTLPPRPPPPRPPPQSSCASLWAMTSCPTCPPWRSGSRRSSCCWPPTSACCRPWGTWCRGRACTSTAWSASSPTWGSTRRPSSRAAPACCSGRR